MKVLSELNYYKLWALILAIALLYQAVFWQHDVEIYARDIKCSSGHFLLNISSLVQTGDKFPIAINTSEDLNSFLSARCP